MTWWGLCSNLLLSEHMDACVIRSSLLLILSMSSDVSSTRLLFCEKKSFAWPFAVTHTSALFEGFGWNGPKLWMNELS